MLILTLSWQGRGGGRGVSGGVRGYIDNYGYIFWRKMIKLEFFDSIFTLMKFKEMIVEPFLNCIK